MALQYLLAPTFQFVNTAGKPLSGGAYMEVYVHGTRTKYFCASDFNGTLHPFRIPLDSLGSNIVLANDTGSYDVYAYNRYGTLMMSRYNVKPGTGGGIGGTITSTDGSIDIHPTEDGVDLSVNGLDPSCLKVSADPRTTDGKFHFDTLVKEGDQAYVDNEGAIRLIKGWYHFTANVQLAWNAGARNETHQVTLYTTLSNSVIDFDISHVHTETIELSGDVSIAQDGSELVIGVSGMPTGLEASVVSMDVHAITGKDGHDKYYAGNGITISNENYIAADFDEVQEKLVAGSGVTIEGNVISAPTLVQAQADWTEEDTESRAYIKHKPDLDVFATKTEVNTGLAGKQNTIPDLAAIRSGAQAGASAVQPADLANVATTGNYNDLNNRPNLTVYATKTEVNTGLATKQNVISDLATIRSGAAAGSTAVQPADLATVATTGDYDDLTNKPDLSVYATTQAMNTALAGKQDTINDLSTIRSGAAAGATALQPSDVATVATTGDYDDLIDKPDLSVYATGAELTAGLATKQDIISDLATIRSGAAEGATAVQPGDLATVATSGSYNDLSDKPSIPAAQVNSDWNASSGVAEILNKPQLSTVATTGDYDDLVNKPSIPAAQVNSDWNAVSGVSEILNKPTLAAVAVSGAYSDLSGTPTIPTATSDLTNDSGYITLGDVPAQVNADWNSSSGASEILNKPSIPSGTQLVPAATSADADKVLTVDAQGTPAWSTPAADGVTDVEVNGVSVVNQGVAEITMPTVDQTYNSASANAQSGVAVADALATVSQVPAVTASDSNKTLVSTYSNGVGSYAWAQNTFVAVYGTTTYDEIKAAIDAGYNVLCLKTDPAYENSSCAGGIGYIYMYGDWRGNIEFNYFQPMPNSSQATASNQGIAKIHIWKVDSRNTWTSSEVVVAPKIGASSPLSLSYSRVNREVTLGVNLGNTLTTANNAIEVAAPIPDVTSVDDGKVLKATYSGGVGSYSWEAESGGTVTDVEVDGTSVVSGGVAEITMPTVDQTYDSASTNAQAGVAVASALSTKQDTISDLSTIRSGAQAGSTAIQPADLATVATTGAYSDLSGTPTIPSATSDLTNDSGFITLSDVPAQVNADWNSSSGASEILNKPTIPSGVQLVPTATSADADKVLTVDAQGTPAWASAQAPISAGTGIDITNNVVSVDTSVVATQTDLAGKEDEFDVGTGLEMDTSGSTPTLQVEAPVDIVAGPGIVIDNPDGNTLRVSTDENYETVLYESNTAVAQGGTFDFSETPENFEYIRVYVVHGATALTWEQIFEYPGDAIRYDIVMFACDQENSLLMDKFYFSRNGNTVTVGVRKRHTVSTSTPTTGNLSNPAFFKKVVGVHRIANN